jgi:hypothetical protein
VYGDEIFARQALEPVRYSREGRLHDAADRCERIDRGRNQRGIGNRCTAVGAEVVVTVSIGAWDVGFGPDLAEVLLCEGRR